MNIIDLQLSLLREDIRNTIANDEFILDTSHNQDIRFFKAIYDVSPETTAMVPKPIRKDLDIHIVQMSTNFSMPEDLRTPTEVIQLIKDKNIIIDTIRSIKNISSNNEITIKIHRDTKTRLHIIALLGKDQHHALQSNFNLTTPEDLKQELTTLLKLP